MVGGPHNSVSHYEKHAWNFQSLTTLVVSDNAYESSVRVAITPVGAMRIERPHVLIVDVVIVDCIRLSFEYFLHVPHMQVPITLLATLGR